MNGSSDTRRLATILAVDIAGFSKASEHDDTASAASVAALRQAAADAANLHGGRIFNTAGDSTMLEFPTASAGTAATAAILAAPGLPPIRAGLHLGEVREIGAGDLIGHGINVATRLQQASAPGTALVSEAVRTLVRDGGSLAFRPAGRITLDKMSETVEAFVLAGPGATAALPAASRRRDAQAVAVYGGIAFAAMAVLALVFGLYNAMNTPAAPVPQAAAPVPAATAPVVAVLPFTNLSDDPNLKFFSDGMTEEIQQALSRISGLRVISSASAFSLGEAGKDPRAAAQALKATHVLTGSVRKNGETVRISSQLLQGDTGAIVWTETLERPLALSLAVQDEIAVRIARALRLIAPEVNAAVAVDPRALELYLRGRDAWRTGGAGSVEARGFLEEAVRIAPNFARAWAALASAYAQAQNFVTGPAQDRMIENAREAARKAIALDATLGEASLVLARFDPNPDVAARGEAFDRAIAADPNDSDLGWLYARFWLNEIGQVEEALRRFKSAYENDPLSVLVTSNYVTNLLETGRAAEAEKVIAEREAAMPLLGLLRSEMFWDAIMRQDLETARALHTRLLESFERAKAIVPKESYEANIRILDLGLKAYVEKDAVALEALKQELRDMLRSGQAGALQAMVALGSMGALDEGFAIGEELYLRSGYDKVDPGYGQVSSPVRYPFGRVSTAPLMGDSAGAMQRDPRIWRIFAATGLAQYWLASGRWPDFCNDPSLGYDCRAAAQTAIDARKTN